MELVGVLKFISTHPLNKGRRLTGIMRFLRWQIGSRLLGWPVVFPWINDSRLVVGRGMTAATGNIYVGLLEFQEMAFVLHYLRAQDVLFDIGANIGAYTVLAAKVVGARCLAVEPVEITFWKLLDNITINRIEDRVTALNIGLGSARRAARISIAEDSINRVLRETETGIPSAKVEIWPLDEARGELVPSAVKVDVEGFETEVVAGGRETFAETGLNVVLMELRGHGSKYGFDEIGVDRTMRALGFKACAYDPFRRIITELPAEHGKLGDMLYIRDIDKAQHRVFLGTKYKIHEKWV